jgi:hypothetical protein
MRSIEQLRVLRVTNRIPAVTLAKKSHLDKYRLSLFENGHVTPSDDELHRLAVALDELIDARKAIEQAAEAAGWPGPRVA